MQQAWWPRPSQNENVTGLGKEQGPSRAAVGVVVRLWFLEVRFRWVELGLGFLRMWLSLLSGFLAFLLPLPLWLLGLFWGVSPKNLFKESKRKETETGRMGKIMDMAKSTAISQKIQVPRLTRRWPASNGP